MNYIHEVVLQIRYPYTAGTLAILWIGTATLASLRHDLPLELVITTVVIVSLIIAGIGFSSPKR